MHSTFIVFLLIASFNPVCSWPEGTFGLPMPKTGCPVGSVIDWETGSRTQRTEKGSHASENVHLAGIESAHADYIVQLFCMKMSFPQEGDFSWMPGKYCILKKGECPDKFGEGYVYWDDNAKWFTKDDTRQTAKDVLPDGEFNQNTKVFYCCRNDGSALTPIRLPSSAPFYLLKSGESCQEVESMYPTEEWVYWADESSHNSNSAYGFYPKMIRNNYSPVYTKLFYCYYQPRPPNRLLQSILTAVYVIAGVIGSIIICVVVICVTVQIYLRCRRHKPADVGINNSSTAQTVSSPIVDCHYVTLQNSDVVTPSAPSTEFDQATQRQSSLPPAYEEVVGLRHSADIKNDDNCG